jgi:putative ABC transport system permease protein
LKPVVLLHFYRVRLRSRLGAELLAVAGIAVGVSLVFAALIANASLTGSVRKLTDGIVGRADFQLSARSADGFDQRIVEEVQDIRGAAAAAVVEARVNLVGPGGWRSVLLVGDDSHLRGRQHGLFLPPPLAAALGLRRGSRVRVETGAGAASIAMSGELAHGGLEALNESPVALAPLSRVQAMTGMRGRISRIFIDARPGHQRAVEAALRRIAGDRLNLAPADQEVALFAHASYPTSASTSLFSTLSALVGFLFALNAMLLTVPQRRRLIADLRMAGYAPATMVLVLLSDALVLGLAGSTLGLLLGGEASRLLFDNVPGYLTSAFAVGSQRIVSWQSAALAPGAGLLAACLSVVLPMQAVLRGVRTAGPAPLPGRSRQDLLTAAGFVALVISLGISAVAPALSLGALALLLSALLLLLAGWLQLAAGAFTAISHRLRSPAAILAALELSAGATRIRTLAFVATGGVAVFATVSIGGAGADLQRGLDEVAAGVNSGAGVWVAFRGPADIFGTTAIEIPPQRLRAIEQIDGVSAVSRNRGSFLDVGQDRAWVLAPAPARIAAVLRGQVKEGEAPAAARLLRHGGWIALSQGLAAGLGVGVGDPIALPTPRPTRLRVAALTDNLGWPGGAIVTSAPTYAQAWGSRGFSTLGVRLRPGASARAVDAAVGSVLDRRGGLRAETSSRREQRARASSRAGLSRLSQISALVLISSALAMAAAMAALIWQRRPTFAALKLHGLSAEELWRALLLESALLVGAGCFAGAAFGVIGQLLLDQALEAITGFPVISGAATGNAFLVLLELTAAAAAVLALPAWLAVRVQPQAGLEPSG